MNSQWICLALVIASYLLGHATGYRLCKLRCKNMLKTAMITLNSIPDSWRPKQDSQMFEALLRDVSQL